MLELSRLSWWGVLPSFSSHVVRSPHSIHPSLCRSDLIIGVSRTCQFVTNIGRANCEKLARSAHISASQLKLLIT